MIGIDPESEGLARPCKLGLRPATRVWTGCWRSRRSRTWSSRPPAPTCTRPPRRGTRSRNPRHRPHPGRRRSGRHPPANPARAHLDAPNVNMVTCGGQATIPMVYAVSRVVDGCPTPRSWRRSRRPRQGPGTRANIDEFTKTTSAGVSEVIGGAKRARRSSSSIPPTRQ